MSLNNDEDTQDEVLCDNVTPKHVIPDHLASKEEQSDKLMLNKIVSLNVNGLGDVRNRNIILNKLDEIRPDIAILVDTRLRDDLATKKSLVFMLLLTE